MKKERSLLIQVMHSLLTLLKHLRQCSKSSMTDWPLLASGQCGHIEIQHLPLVVKKCPWWKFHEIRPLVKTDGSLTVRLNTTEKGKSSLFLNRSQDTWETVFLVWNLKLQYVNFFRSSFPSNFWPCQRYSRQAATTLTTLNFPPKLFHFFWLDKEILFASTFFGLKDIFSISLF